MSATERECTQCIMEMYSGRCPNCFYLWNLPSLGEGAGKSREECLKNDVRVARLCMAKGEHNRLTAWYYQWKQKQPDQDAAITCCEVSEVAS